MLIPSIWGYAQATDRGKALRAFCATLTAKGPTSQVWLLPPYLYDLGATPLAMPPCTLRGMDRVGTYLTCSSDNDLGQNPNGLCSFELSNGSAVEDMTLDANCGIAGEAPCIGFGDASQVSSAIPRSAAVRRVNALGRAWDVYSWSQAGNYLLLEDCTLTGGRLVVANMNSHGSYLDLVRCLIVVDPTRSTRGGGGSVSNPTWGGTLAIVNRNGWLRALNCQAVIQPQDGFAAKGFTDLFYPQAGVVFAPQSELVNYVVSIRPQAPSSYKWPAQTLVRDIDCQVGATTYTGGSGSGLSGAYLTNVVSPGTLTKF